MALNRLGDPTDARASPSWPPSLAGGCAGVQSYVPWGTDGLSLDLMRRDDDGENGVTEAMIAALVQACPDLGIARVSLNFAVLRGVFEAAERVAPGPLVRTGNAALAARPGSGSCSRCTGRPRATSPAGNPASSATTRRSPSRAWPWPR